MGNLEIVEAVTRDGVSSIAARRFIGIPPEEGAIVLGRIAKDEIQILSEMLTGPDLLQLSRKHAAILTIDGDQYIRALDGTVRVDGEAIAELYRLDPGCSVQLFSVGSVDGYLTRPKIPKLDPYQTSGDTQTDISHILQTDRAILDRLEAIERSITKLQRSDSQQNEVLKKALVGIGIGVLLLVAMKIIPIDLVNSIGQLLGVLLGIASLAMGLSRSTKQAGRD